MTSYALSVNNLIHNVDVTGDMPLLWVLRDVLGLTGTKYGCGMGVCGACTVHSKGKAIRACVTPVAGVVGTQITTIEGLSRDNNHPVQRAWRELRVPQCGYCQSGQIMMAASLIGLPEISAEKMRQAMNGNICRCGTYCRIEAAIVLAVHIANENSR